VHRLRASPPDVPWSYPPATAICRYIHWPINGRTLQNEDHWCRLHLLSRGTNGNKRSSHRSSHSGYTRNPDPRHNQPKPAGYSCLSPNSCNSPSTRKYSRQTYPSYSHFACHARSAPRLYIDERHPACRKPGDSAKPLHTKVRPDRNPPRHTNSNYLRPNRRSSPGPYHRMPHKMRYAQHPLYQDTSPALAGRKHNLKQG